MPREKKNKTLSVVFWILTAFVMAIIFFLSSRNADESASQSSWLLTIINSIFGATLTDFIIRKAAHFCEYVLLCFLFNCSFYLTFKKNRTWLSLALTSLYAATDEIHQIFVEGRSCELRDWAIDTAGAIVGLTVFVIITFIANQYKQKKIDRVHSE
ncbi:MAG: VanZ family protein [Eubacterium sp.]|nr:VanZ family protein [Eubacterium sp.]